LDTLGLCGREREAVLQHPVCEAVDRQLDSAFYSVHALRRIRDGNIVSIKRSGNMRADCTDYAINDYSKHCDTYNRILRNPILLDIRNRLNVSQADAETTVGESWN
jgi:hypothetical protein